jgi:hypothetical protein
MFWNCRGLIASLAALWLSGCIGLDAFPVAARAGDTVTLALGSPEGMNRGNTTVAFEDFQGNTHDLTANVRGIFNLFPDKASKAWDSPSTAQLVSSARHEAWLTVMALDLPASLPVGTGTIRVSSAAIYPNINAHVNDVPIRLEILPGTGISNPLEYVFGIEPSSAAFGNIQDLEPRPSVAVYTNSTGSNLFAAIEIKLHIETNKGIELVPSDVRVLMEDLMIITESQRNWFWNLDNGQDYTITLLSPYGLLTEYETRFKVVFNRTRVANTPTITSIRYFDINGVEVVGPPADQYTIIIDNG